MTNVLSNYIHNFQKDNNNFIEILTHFKSKIKYLSYKLKYPEAETDLIIYLYELLPLININNFNKKDTDLKNYINKCLQNRSFYLYKQVRKDIENIYYTSETEVLDVLSNTNTIDDSSDLIFYDLISKLNHNQRQILFYKFYLQLSDIEIAEIFKVSRQAIHKSKQKALNTLKLQLQN